MCREVVIFGAEYFKQPHKYGLETLISESLRKCILLPPLPFTRSDFKDPILGSENWKKKFRRSDFKVPCLCWECRMVIYSVFTWSDFQSWQRMFDLAPKRTQGYHAKFVGAFHLSRRVSDENRACSISIRFFKLTDPFVGRSFLLCSHDPIFGTNKNRILKIGSCERALRPKTFTM